MSASEAAERRLARLLARCRDDPDLFNTAILGRPPYWSGADRGAAGQREWCRALVEYRAVAIETGNMLGKDYWVGGIVPWWLWTRRNSLVVVMGPGQSLIGAVTWKEVRKAIEGARFPMGGRISKGIKTSPHTVTLGTDWQALGFSTTSVERASGQHNANLLAIVEEASGVDQETWDAINSWGYTKLAAVFNPLRADGGAVDLCNRAEKDRAAGLPKHQSVCHLNVPSTAGPHATWETSPHGMASKTWLDEQARRYGVDSLWYRSHVLAIRPTLATEALIAPAHLDACISDAAANAARALRAKFKAGPRRIACDVGEGVGNARTVVIVGDDAGVVEVHASAYTDPAGAAEQVVRLAQKHGVKEADVSFDAAGVTGKRLRNALRGLGYGRAHPYFGSDPGGRWCANQRTAAAQAFARRIDPDHYPGPNRVQQPYHVPPSAEWAAMREELEALRVRLKGDKVALEAKAEMMAELGRSPDFADCLTQLFWRAAVQGS